MFAVPCDLWYRGKGCAGRCVSQGHSTRVFASHFSSQTGWEDLASPTGTSSTIDLTSATPSLSLNYTWKPLDDLHGSDHLPVLQTIRYKMKDFHIGK